MKVEPTEIKKKGLKERISEQKIYVIMGMVIISLLFLFFIFGGSSVCEVVTFQYENQIVPAKVCLDKFMNYEVDGAKKNVEFTASFIKNLVISYGGK